MPAHLHTYTHDHDVLSDDHTHIEGVIEPLTRLTRDIRASVDLLSHQEVRYLVDLYYETQRSRIASANQVRSLGREGEPVRFLSWVFETQETMERSIKNALNRYTTHEPTGVGAWLHSITGIGPVIAAGLLANLDIERAPTVGHYWRFAGLDPTTTWDKGTKRPWNASLKRLCWIAGESFVKTQNNKNDTYGQLYVGRKAREQARNEAGDFADQAAASLSAKRYGDDTAAKASYTQGKLPPARIHLRATRWTVKLFLAHLHTVQYWQRYQAPPPRPYVLDNVPGHAHAILPPNLELWPGLHVALEDRHRGAA